ncbi:MAG TPA: DNA polymerase III subunit delta' [Dehalococcoidia bacterium]|nr:DNA polymerase III subunit delta' [Dehalococcoidia bacterium]
MTWDVVGQDRAVAALERALAAGRPAHAYLFVGPERVGKHALALRLAQALNCEGAVGAGAPTYGGDERAVSARGEPVEPCGECKPCRRIAGGIHADVQTVTVEEAEEEDERRKGIHVSQIREIGRVTALKPFEGRSRVVIIDPADEMNAAAQNAFLKTLEEPPPQVVFVLVTADDSRLLPTIRSRCRRLELRLPSVADVEAALLERGVEGERAKLLARLSRGRVGWALEVAADPALLERRQESVSQARALASMTVAERLGLAERLAPEFKREPEALLVELAAWRDWWRDVLLVQAGAEDGVANVDGLGALREDAAHHGREGVAVFVRAVDQARRYLGENAQPRLVLETLLLDAPAAARR